MQATATWRGDMCFSAEDEAGRAVKMDAAVEVGGSDSGFRPKHLLLDSLAGCTGMDVISILRKMKLSPDSFQVEVSATMRAEHPRIFTDFHIKYLLSGEVPEAKLNKAIKLSHERYCGVTAMFASFATITHEVVRTD